MAQDTIARVAGHAGTHTMIRVPGAAVLARAASLGQRHHDAIAALDILDVLADFLDYAGEFMAEDGRQPRFEADPAPIALP